LPQIYLTVVTFTPYAASHARNHDRGTATVVDAFLATIEAGGDAPAILDADVKVAL
jgi:hypothetical protein